MWGWKRSQGFAPNQQVSSKLTGAPCRRSLGKGELDCEVNLRCPLGRPEEEMRNEVLMAAHRAQAQFRVESVKAKVVVGRPAPQRGNTQAWMGAATEPTQEGREAGTREPEEEEG